MKTTLLAGLLVVAALWFGYDRGYHNGVQTERHAWELTAQLDKSSIVRLGGEDEPNPILYRNPHSGLVIVTSGHRQVNAPDLRSSPVK
jgi:hypothetical protein